MIVNIVAQRAKSDASYVDAVGKVSLYTCPHAGSYGVQCTNVALGGVSSAIVVRVKALCDGGKFQEVSWAREDVELSFDL